MWLDLTREISLSEKKYSLYKKLQTTLYVVAFLIAVIMAVRVIFDSQNFYFSFTPSNANNSSVNYPRYQKMDSVVENGNLSTGTEIYFDTVPIGTFSKATVKFPSNIARSFSGTISVRKSHQAFLYPESTPIGFKNGSLLKNTNEYYIVSENKLRNIPTSILSTLGYSITAFIEASEEDLQYTPAGDPLLTSESYPDFSLFKIEDDYYLLEKSSLKKFTSETAFLSQYRISQAIEKTTDLFSRYPLSEEQLGFADGSLVSYRDSIYIISQNKYYPINNPETFIAKGYDWNDVIPATTDEVSLYEKTALFTIRRNHPAGTVFKTIGSGKYYIIDNLEKHLLPSQSIADSWSARSPILVSEKSPETIEHCTLQKNYFGSEFCELQIDSLRNLPGVNYEFIMKLDTDTSIEDLNISFSKDLNRSNLIIFLQDIYNKIKNKYAPKIT